MTELATDAFRTIGPDDAIPNDFVDPYYLDDRKLRISVARVDDRFDITTRLVSIVYKHILISSNSVLPGRLLRQTSLTIYI
jgi:hypothetical protein